MSLLLSFIPVLWLNQGLQDELLHADGHFNYDRFWNPDVRVQIDDYNLWCWNGSGLKFTDTDITDIVHGRFPEYTPLTETDVQTCGS